jgi:hypothetical protein
MRLLLFLLFSAHLSFSQTDDKLSGFMGLEFGSSYDSSKAHFIKKGGIVSPESDKELLIISGLQFGGRDTDLIGILFHNNKFHTARIAIAPPKFENEIIAQYNAIKDEINTKYFVSKKDYEQYESPYETGDNHTITAIKVNKCKISCFWFFSDQNTVSIKINPDVYVSIVYQSDALISEAIEDKKKKAIQDY